MREDLKAKHWLLIADGQALPALSLQKLAQNKNVLVLDGAYAHACSAEIKVDVLLGDFDTITPQDLAQASTSSVFIVPTPDQNKTDLQKGLIFLDELQALSIDICAATGKRLQHTLYNLRMLKKFHQLTRPLRLLTAKEIIRYAENAKVKLEAQIGSSIAVFGFPHANVTSQGLQYELLNTTMDFEQFNSVSNRFKEEKVYLQVKGGILFIVEKM